jgi:hypothetical protein
MGCSQNYSADTCEMPVVESDFCSSYLNKCMVSCSLLIIVAKVSNSVRQGEDVVVLLWHLKYYLYQTYEVLIIVYKLCREMCVRRRMEQS